MAGNDTEIVADLGYGFNLQSTRAGWQVVGSGGEVRSVTADEATVLRALASLGLPSDTMHVFKRATEIMGGKPSWTKSDVFRLLKGLHEGFITFYGDVVHPGFMTELRGRWALPSSGLSVEDADDAVRLGPGRLFYSPFYRLLQSWNGRTQLTDRQARVLDALLQRHQEGHFQSNADLAESMGISLPAFQRHNSAIQKYLMAHEHPGFPDPQKRDTKYAEVAYGKLFEFAVKEIIEQNTPWRERSPTQEEGQRGPNIFENMEIDLGGILDLDGIPPGKRDRGGLRDELIEKKEELFGKHGGNRVPIGVEVEYRVVPNPGELDGYVRDLQSGRATLFLRDRKYPYFADNPDNQLFVALAVLTDEQQAHLRSLLPTEEEFLSDLDAAEEKFLKVSLPEAFIYLREIERESDGKYGLVKGLLHVGGKDLLSYARMERPLRGEGHNPLKTYLFFPRNAMEIFGKSILRHFTPRQYAKLGAAMMLKAGGVVKHDPSLAFESRPLAAEHVMELFPQLERSLNGQLDPAGVPYGFGGIESLDRAHSGSVRHSSLSGEVPDQFSLQDRVLDALFEKFRTHGAVNYASGKAGDNMRILQIDINVSQALSELRQVLSGSAVEYRKLAEEYGKYSAKHGGRKRESFAQYAEEQLNAELRRIDSNFKGGVALGQASALSKRRYDLEAPIEAVDHYSRVYRAIMRFERYLAAENINPDKGRITLSNSLLRAVGFGEKDGRIEFHATDPHEDLGLFHESYAGTTTTTLKEEGITHWAERSGIPLVLHCGVPSISLASYFGACVGGGPELARGLFDIILHSRPIPGLSGPLQTAVITDIDHLLAKGGIAIFHTDTRHVTGMMAGDANLSEILERQKRATVIRDTARGRIISLHPRSIVLKKSGNGQLALPGLASNDIQEILKEYSRYLSVAVGLLGRLHSSNQLTPDMFNANSAYFAQTVLSAANPSVKLEEGSQAADLAEHIETVRSIRKAPYLSTADLLSLMHVRRALTGLSTRLPKTDEAGALREPFSGFRYLVGQRITASARRLLEARLSTGLLLMGSSGPENEHGQRRRH